MPADCSGHTPTRRGSNGRGGSCRGWTAATRGRGPRRGSRRTRARVSGSPAPYIWPLVRRQRQFRSVPISTNVYQYPESKRDDDAISHEYRVAMAAPTAATASCANRSPHLAQKSSRRPRRPAHGVLLVLPRQPDAPPNDGERPLAVQPRDRADVRRGIRAGYLTAIRQHRLMDRPILVNCLHRVSRSRNTPAGCINHYSPAEIRLPSSRRHHCLSSLSQTAG